MKYCYAKGSQSERELAKILWKWGFSVIRAAGSAKYRYSSPDLVAIKNKVAFAFECKARKNYVKLKPQELFELREWCQRSGAHGFLAWKISRVGWFFLSIDELDAGINEKSMQERAIRTEDIVSMQA